MTHEGLTVNDVKLATKQRVIQDLLEGRFDFQKKF
jgi:hypothetical protein